ncbi:MAG TPA: aldehyde dehydrogenase family protein, partial [Limnochordales bacterium]
MEEAGLPPGVLNVVLGSGPETGAPLVEHPRVRVIAFTGSTETGSLIAGEGARRGKRVLLEMGGKNAITVMDDADLDLAVEGILWSAFGTTGQRCTAASRLIVHRAVMDELIYTEGEGTRGFFYRRTLFPGVHPGMRIAREEIFGPTAVIIPCDSLEEAVRINNDSAYGLFSSIYTREVNRAMRAARDMTTGIVYINHGTTGAEVHLPF